jgi:hypothetical protein
MVQGQYNGNHIDLVTLGALEDTLTALMLATPRDGGRVRSTYEKCARDMQLIVDYFRSHVIETRGR